MLIPFDFPHPSSLCEKRSISTLGEELLNNPVNIEIYFFITSTTRQSHHMSSSRQQKLEFFSERARKRAGEIPTIPRVKFNSICHTAEEKRSVGEGDEIRRRSAKISNLFTFHSNLTLSHSSLRSIHISSEEMSDVV